MTRFDEAVRHDLADAPSPPPFERIRHRAQRRRIRFWATGLVSLAAVGALGLIVVRSEQRSPRVNVHPAVSATTASDVAVFDDTGGVSAVDFANRTVTHYPLGGWRPGDQPFLSLRVGDDLVAGWGDVYATPMSGGTSRPLGTGVFVPAVEPGAVWLTSYGQVQTPTERLVDMHGRVLLQGRTPHDAAGRTDTAITGVPGGLALQTATGLAIWDARTGRITRRLGSGPGVTAVPMSGSQLAWCDHCDRALEITDLTTGTTRSVAVSLNGGFLDLQRYFAFSPDGTHLAIPAQPDGAAPLGVTTKIITVDVKTAEVADQIDAHTRYATAVWSPDSKRLYIAASNTGSGGRVLVHDQSTDTTRDLGPVPAQSGSFSVVITHADDAQLPTPTAASAETCPAPTGTAASTKPCSYRF
jgi:hypothetical protein